MTPTPARTTPKPITIISTTGRCRMMPVLTILVLIAAVAVADQNNEGMTASMTTAATTIASDSILAPERQEKQEQQQQQQQPRNYQRSLRHGGRSDLRGLQTAVTDDNKDKNNNENKNDSNSNNADVNTNKDNGSSNSNNNNSSINTNNDNGSTNNNNDSGSTNNNNDNESTNNNNDNESTNNNNDNESTNNNNDNGSTNNNNDNESINNGSITNNNGLNLLTQAKTSATAFWNNTNIANASVLSLSACEHIDRAISYLTSLHWNLTDLQVIAQQQQSQQQQSQRQRQQQQQVDTTSPATIATIIWRNITLADQRAELRDVYLLQGFVIVPLSLGFLFWGSSCLWPVCMVSAAALGVFFVFHSLPRWLSSWSVTWLDCPMKLSLSTISGLLSALLASTFLRFGIFCLGAVTAGSATYLVFDAFPQLDLMNNGDYNQIFFTTAAATANIAMNATLDGAATTTTAYLSSTDLSPFGWFVTGFMGLLGGWLLRWKEEATLEFITSLMGGMGLSFSVHTTVLLRGGDLDRSWVVLLASISALFGWHVQRRRRIIAQRYEHYRQVKQHDYEPHVPLPPTPPRHAHRGREDMAASAAMPPPPIPMTPMMIHPYQWHTLQSMLQSLVPSSRSAPSSPRTASSTASSSSASKGGAAPEQISELIAAIHSLTDRLADQNKIYSNPPKSSSNNSSSSSSSSRSSPTTTTSANTPLPSPPKSKTSAEMSDKQS